MNEQTLELQIKSKSQEASVSIDKLVSKLTGIEKSVTSIDNKLKSNSVKTITSNINYLTGVTDKATTSFNKFGSTLKNALTFTGVKNITGTLLGWMNEAIDYTEQLNLFNTVFNNIEENGVQTFSELGKEAINFQHKLNEAFGTNKTNTLYMQGIFQSMGETVGIDDKYSAVMSETMTKLTYDLASLYNKTESATAEAIRAGVYAGQTKPLRSYGIDITQMSLQPIVNELGITGSDGELKSVKNMSQAEKEILRYLATLKQAKIAMGDLANTIESPSNQLKVFRQQLVETKVAVSSLFIGSFSQALPYANALLMVVKEVSKAIADMFGIELKDYNSGIASQEDAYVDFGDSVDDTTKKVKELKRQVLGFDEIHNINENKDTSGTSGGSTSGGIDQRLLDAITGYDNGMDKVRMKASQIRDDIMKWLGFTKEIDPLTGEVSFKYQGIKTTLKNMWDSFEGLSTQGKILVGLGLVVGATKLWNIGKKLVTVTGSSGLGKAIQWTLSPFSALVGWMKLGVQVNGNLISGFKEGFSTWKEQLSAVDTLKTSVLLLVTGYSLLHDANKKELNVKTFAEAEAGIMSMQASLALLSDKAINASDKLKNIQFVGTNLGNLAGPIGMLVGSITGLVTTIVDGSNSIKKAHDSTVDAYKKYSNALAESTEIAKDSANSSLVLVERGEELVEELGELTDANGKVKKGYEDRVSFILNQLNNAFGTEYQLIDGVITKNDGLKTSYQEIKDSLQEVIKNKKTEIILNAFEDQYAEALKNKKNIQDEINKKQEIYNTMKKMATENEKEAAEYYGVSVKELRKSLDRQKEGLENLQSQLEVNQESIMNYEDLMEANLSGNVEDLDKALYKFGVDTDKNMSNTVNSTNQKFNTLTKNVETSCASANPKISIKGVYENFIQKVQDQIKGKSVTIDVKANIKELTGKVNTLFDISSFGWTKKENGGVFSNGSWKNIQQYANGGVPSHGSMFVAGEHGAEIVGHINGKTEVLNQSQLASAIYSSMVSAMSQYGGGGIAEINVHADKGVIVETAVNGIQQHVNQTGTLPFTIPTY